MYVHTLGATKIENEVYFSSANFNGLFRMNLSSRKMEYITKFEHCPKYQRAFYGRQHLAGDKIYFVPIGADELAIYDTKNSKLEYMDVDKGKNGILGSFIENQYLWLLMREYPNRMVRLNLENYEKEENSLDWEYIFSQIGEDVRKEAGFHDSPFLQTVYENDTIWYIPNYCSGRLISYNIRTKQTCVHILPGYEQEKIHSIAVKDDVMIVVLKDKKKILEWNRNASTIQKRNVDDLGEKVPTSVLSVAAEHDWVVVGSKGVFVFDRDSGEVYRFLYSGTLDIRSYVKTEDGLWLFPYEGENVIWIDLNQKKMEEWKFVWDKPITTDDITELFRNQLWEDTCGVDEYLDAIERQETKQQNEECIDGGAGKRIWEFLKNVK